MKILEGKLNQDLKQIGHSNFSTFKSEKDSKYN